MDHGDLPLPYLEGSRVFLTPGLRVRERYVHTFALVLVYWILSAKFFTSAPIFIAYATMLLRIWRTASKAIFQNYHDGPACTNLKILFSSSGRLSVGGGAWVDVTPLHPTWMCFQLPKVFPHITR